MFEDDSVLVEAEVVPMSRQAAAIANVHEEAVNKAREKLSKYLGRAVEIITELAETSENDRVRLAAAESIADRAGLGKSSTTQVNVSQSEHEAARREAEELVARLGDNRGIPAVVVEPDLDTLIVLEGEVDTVEV
jgi:hypothetical protein